jgi:hypothetical protein
MGVVDGNGRDDNDHVGRLYLFVRSVTLTGPRTSSLAVPLIRDPSVDVASSLSDRQDSL